MDIVCFDTHVLIWGIRKQSNPGQEIQIQKAEKLIKICEGIEDDNQGKRNKKRVIIPSIVVAEFLCGAEPDKINDFNQLIHRLFIVKPFDTIAAVKFAEIWKKKQSLKLEKQEISRAEMKADFMIVATAVASGAKCIYSEDDKLQKFAEGYIEVEPLPSIQKQTELFSNS